MTIIAIYGFPSGYSKKQLVLLLTPIIGDEFQFLKFDAKLRNPKRCYIRVSNKVDVLKISAKINVIRIGHYKLLSYIPPQTSGMPEAKSVKQISAKMPQYPPGFTTETILQYTHEQIMLEMQSIYTGLYALNNKTGDKLLEGIGEVVYDRLKVISNNQKIEACIKFTQLYRRMHPHLEDFQLILTMLHKIQDETGKPRLDIEEKELLIAGIKSYDISTISQKQIEDTSAKYTEKITKAVVDHVSKLSTTMEPHKNSTEETARTEVREKLQSMLPFFPNIIRDVISKHLSPSQSTLYLVKIYGSPCLPGAGSVRQWAQCFNLQSVCRSENCYNLLRARCSASHYGALMDADGLLLDGAKLIIRPADTPYKKVPISIQNDLRQSTAEVEQSIEDAEMEWTGEW